MDHHTQFEEMKSLGFLGIFSQSLKTIIKFRKIFTRLTIDSILPMLPIEIIFAHMCISDQFLKKIEQYPYEMILIAYKSYYDTAQEAITESQDYLLFKYFTIYVVMGLSNFAMPVVAFTIASMYTTGQDRDEEVTYKKTMKAVSFCSSRLLRTFVFKYFLVLAIQHVVAIPILLCYVLMGRDRNNVHLYVIAIFVLNVFGFVYLITVSHIASVVTVLDTTYHDDGVGAMIKAVKLINGKKKVAMAVSFILHGLLACVVVCMFMGLRVYNLNIYLRVIVEFLTAVLLVIVFLEILVVHTVVYFVCKSYHQETVVPATYVD